MKDKVMLDRENRRLFKVCDNLVEAWEVILRLTPEITELEKQAPATFKRVRDIIERSKAKMLVKH